MLSSENKYITNTMSSGTLRHDESISARRYMQLLNCDLTSGLLCLTHFSMKFDLTSSSSRFISKQSERATSIIIAIIQLIYYN